jgi:serine phosphatase RsbU (regulator of sigma subunit)
MDSVLVISQEPEDLVAFLQRLGYMASADDPASSSDSIVGSVSERIIDLVVVDGRTISAFSDIVKFFRSQELTERLPVVLFADLDEQSREEFKEDERLEILALDAGKGVLASKVAMLLRLRKMDGKSPEAHIAEMNAALRDFTEKVSKDLEEARAIQLATLPKVAPTSEKFDIAYSYDPLEELCGDWFFVEEEDDGTISFLVADVTGHGLAAAFIGGWLKLALWAAKSMALSPDKRLAEINRHITPQMPDGRFITMACLNFNPEGGIVRQGRAGHPPTLLLRNKERRVEQLLGDGFAVGFFEEGDYELVETTMEPGDILAVFTDGIVEAQNMDGAMYGPEGLEKAMLALDLSLPSHAIMEILLQDLEQFTGGRLIKDDVTLIILKRL